MRDRRCDQLRQVLVNILLNAAQALRGSGHIEISLAKQSDLGLIYVDDSGPGIPEADREKVFQPFFSTKAHDEGTGLGLPLCRKMVEAQRWRNLCMPRPAGRRTPRGFSALVGLVRAGITI